MASFTCHVVGVTKRARVERTVSRDQPAEMKRGQGRLNRSPGDRAHLGNCQRRTLQSPSLLGRQCLRDHAPPSATEAGERNATMPECASGKVTEAGRPKPATNEAEWPWDATEAESGCSSSFDAPNT